MVSNQKHVVLTLHPIFSSSYATCLNIGKSIVLDVWKVLECVKQFFNELDGCKGVARILWMGVRVGLGYQIHANIEYTKWVLR